MKTFNTVATLCDDIMLVMIHVDTSCICIELELPCGTSKPLAACPLLLCIVPAAQIYCIITEVPLSRFSSCALFTSMKRCLEEFPRNRNLLRPGIRAEVGLGSVVAD